MKRRPYILKIKLIRPNSKAQYERAFRIWGMRKHIKSDEWKYIANLIAPKLKEKKEFRVLFNQSEIPNEKVLRETRRYNYQTTWERLQTSKRSHCFMNLLTCIIDRQQRRISIINGLYCRAHPFSAPNSSNSTSG